MTNRLTINEAVNDAVYRAASAAVNGSVNDGVRWAVNGTVNEAAREAVHMTLYNAVWRAVEGAVWGAGCEVSGAIRWTDDGTAESGVSGAGHNDPDHPALQDFMRSAAAGVGAV